MSRSATHPGLGSSKGYQTENKGQSVQLEGRAKGCTDSSALRSVGGYEQDIRDEEKWSRGGRGGGKCRELMHIRICRRHLENESRRKVMRAIVFSRAK